MKKIFLLVTLLLSAICIYSQTPEHDFFGVPIRVVVTDEEQTSEKELTGEEMKQNIVVILKSDSGNDYEWLTRERTAMFKKESGIYLLYYGKEGSGFVKINTLNHSYIEVVHTGLTTITYYGYDYDYVSN